MTASKMVFKMAKILYVFIVSLLVYVIYSVSMLLTARAHELVVYAIVNPKTFVSIKAMPLPFGRDITLFILENKDEHELSDIFVYDILSMPDELSIEGGEVGYKVSSDAQFVSEKIVSILLNKGVDINSFGYSGCTSLHLAIKENNKQAKDFLLSKGASLSVNNLNSKNEFCQVSARDLMGGEG